MSLLSVTAVCSLIISIQGVVAAQSTQCLQYDDQFANRTVINVATGAKTGGEATEAIKTAMTGSRDSAHTQLSPDGKHEAIQYTTGDNQDVFGLLSAHTVNAQLDLKNAANDGFRHFDVMWSPDSQWISSLSSKGDDGYFLTVMDVAGQQQREQLVSTRAEDWISSFGWSADGRYVAISVSDSFGHNLRKIEIWSMPDLKLAKLIKPPSSEDSPRGFGNPSPFDRIQWSPKGDWLAYLNHLVTGMDDLFTLNLYSVDSDKTTTFDLPNLKRATDFGVALSWSPNGKFLALISTSYSYDFIGRLGVFGIDGSSDETVSNKVMSERILTDGGVGFPITYWSPDGHALLFIEDLPQKYLNVGALVAYMPDSKQMAVVHPHIYMNPRTTPDSHYLIALSPNDGQDHDGYNNADATPAPAANNSIVVIDTNTFTVHSLSALGEIPDMFQVFVTTLNQSEWLLLSDSDTTTWAINPQTGDQFAFFAEHEIETNRKNLPFYVPIFNTEFLARWDGDDSMGWKLSLVSLRDHSSQTIPYTFGSPNYIIAASADRSLMAVDGEPYIQGRKLDIMKADGTVLWSYPIDEKLAMNNLIFTTCN